MSTMLIQSETLENIADAIRSKTGSVDTMTPAEMVTEIGSIEGKVKILENFKGTFSLPSSGNWKPHTITKAGYITAMFICTYSSQTVQIRKGTTNISTIYANDSVHQSVGAHRVAVQPGDVIQVWKSADANGACEYLLIFEEES